MERFSTYMERGLAAWHALNLLQQCLVGAVGLTVGYLVLEGLLRSARGVATTAFVLVVATAVVRLCFPATFCAVSWPSLMAVLCPR